MCLAAESGDQPHARFDIVRIGSGTTAWPNMHLLEFFGVRRLQAGTFDTIEELRAALVEFATRYNETWLVARHGYRTPAQVRADQCRLDQNTTADLKLAA